ncbi:MAG: DegT/DnrJ/EryC1/StrS family aminotransferase [Desulfomonilaceae bacterium]
MGLMKLGKQYGIQTSIHYPEIHKFTGYKKFRTNVLAFADHVTVTDVNLPIFPNMTDSQLVLVCHPAKVFF